MEVRNLKHLTSSNLNVHTKQIRQNSENSLHLRLLVLHSRRLMALPTAGGWFTRKATCGSGAVGSTTRHCRKREHRQRKRQVLGKESTHFPFRRTHGLKKYHQEVRGKKSLPRSSQEEWSVPWNLETRSLISELMLPIAQHGTITELLTD